VNEIVIPKRMIVTGLILIGLAAALVWGAPQILSRFKTQANVHNVPTLSATALAGQEDNAARDAALAGAQAFYSVDYQKGQKAWLDKLCSVSTKPAAPSTRMSSSPTCGASSKEPGRLPPCRSQPRQKSRIRSPARGECSHADLAIANPIIRSLAHANKSPDHVHRIGSGGQRKRSLEV